MMRCRAIGTLVMMLLLCSEASAQCPPRSREFFENPLVFELEDPATHLVVEDFNRDGISDIATGGLGRRVAIRLGFLLPNRRIEFGSPVFIPADSTPMGFTTADFNGDEVSDLAIATHDGDRLLIYLGRGRMNEWRMMPFASYPTGSRPVSVASGDLNGDGRPDLVVANSGSRTLTAYMGRGDGSFGARSHYSLSTPVGEVQLADLDRDGLLDAAIAGHSGVNVMLGNGSSGAQGGLFRKADLYRRPSLSGGLDANVIRLADFNADGLLDCLLAYRSWGNIAVFAGSMSGSKFSFIYRSDALSAGGVVSTLLMRGATAADLDLDGHLDVASVSHTETFERLSVCFGDGNFGFTPPYRMPGPLNPIDIAATDLDGDGSPDLIMAGSGGAYSTSRGPCLGGAPIITGFDPAAGAVDDTVVVLGQVLKNVTTARINGVVAEIVRRSVTTLTVRVRPGSSSGPITLENTKGIGTSPTIFVVGQRPVVVSLEPDRAKAGQPVRLLGRWFTGAGQVRFGGAPAQFEVLADSVVRAVVDSASQSGPVAVRTIIGEGVSPIPFTVLPPDTAPRLDAIRDVPDDEGGRVFVEWLASDLDVPGRDLVSEYRVLRRAVDGGWEKIADAQALGLIRYSVLANTRADSTGTGIPYQTYVVLAVGADTNVTYPSLPDSGYSVDNRAPPKPERFEAKTAGTSVVLRWDESTASDLQSHRLYRGDRPEFSADSLSFVAEVDDTTFTDETPGKRPHYKLVAFDLHGNASPAAEATPDVLTPTLLSLVLAETRPGNARLVWHGASLASRRGRIDRSTGSFWSAVAEVTSTTDGTFEFEDRSAPAGRVFYQLHGADGADDWSSEIVTVVVPPAIFALGVPWPQPVRNLLRVPVSLPAPGTAALEVLDITGRRMVRRNLTLDAGETVVEFGDFARLPAGIYHLRFTHGPRSATRRIALVR